MSAREDMRRLDELAVSKLLDTHSAEEAIEYRALLDEYPTFRESAVEELLAVAHLACLPTCEELPPRLRSSLEASAAKFLDQPQPAPTAPVSTMPRREPRIAPWVAWSGWLTAAAACLFAIVLGLRPPRIIQAPPMVRTVEVRRPTPPDAATATRPPPPQAPAAPDLAAERRAFLATHPHVIERAFRPGGDPTGARVQGDVVWDEASQRGYLRFVNLQRNEPNSEVYQLWIFDGERDQRYPIDGGVFDIRHGATETIVPIRAQLAVKVPLAFAVTVERPGGVVVSDRSRVAALASVT